MTMGSTDQPCSDGGDGTAHSNVSAPHGLGPAGSPLRKLWTTLTTKAAMPATIIVTPAVEIRL